MSHFQLVASHSCINEYMMITPYYKHTIKIIDFSLSLLDLDIEFLFYFYIRFNHFLLFCFLTTFLKLILIEKHTI